MTALDRIVKSEHFAQAPRLVALLRFLVEAAVSDPAVPIGAYAIAVEALGLGGDFDPSTDSRVHVEVARLRRALARYDLESEAEERVFIELPRGSYVPQFRIRTHSRLRTG